MLNGEEDEGKDEPIDVSIVIDFCIVLFKRVDID